MNTTKLHQDAIHSIRRKNRAELLAKEESLTFWRNKSADQDRQIRDLKMCGCFLAFALGLLTLLPMWLR